MWEFPSKRLALPLSYHHPTANKAAGQPASDVFRQLQLRYHRSLQHQRDPEETDDV